MSSESLSTMQEAFWQGKISSKSVIEKIVQRYAEDQKSVQPLNGFLELYADVLDLASACDAEYAVAQKEGTKALEALRSKKPLLGMPFGVKDNISVKGRTLTCGSNILKGYCAPYNATVVERLISAGAIPVGRCNQDEFAMGSSTEYSVYGPSRNPHNRDYVPGGSSGGSAAVVAEGLVPLALGTETGGSVRLPASYCGIYGLKPTYGALSRWGVVAFGSSLDQVGIFARTPYDVACSFSVMVGKDAHDETSEVFDVDCVKDFATYFPLAVDFSSLRIAIPSQFLNAQGLDDSVRSVFETVRSWFIKKGAFVEEVDIPILEASLASYYVIALSEAASNLSRFDGIRYGNRIDVGEGYDELYIKTRSEGFGPEVKRRIIIGNYVLSEQFSGPCYKKAMAVRARMQKEVAALYDKYDMILAPTGPTPAFKLGQKVEDPMAMYLSDMYTIFVNLSRTASLSVPAGVGTVRGTNDIMPVGVQFAGPRFSEFKLLSIAHEWQADFEQGGLV